MVSTHMRNQYIENFKECHEGNLEIFKQNKDTYSSDMIQHTLLSAIEKNNTECVRYIVDNHLVNIYDKPYCDIAAKCGAYDCLKILHENGCSFRKYTALLCMIRGDARCLQYVLKNGGELNMPA